MRVIRKSQTDKFSNSPTCSGFGFDFSDTDINIAVVTVDGRYPEKGHLINEVCKEIAYVLSGKGIVGVGSEVNEIKSGDAVFIEPGEKFYWQGDRLEMLMPCSPAFYPKQHKEVE